MSSFADKGVLQHGRNVLWHWYRAKARGFKYNVKEWNKLWIRRRKRIIKAIST